MSATAEHDNTISELLHTLIDYAPDGVALATLDGTLIYANPTFSTMLGEDIHLNSVTIYDMFTEEEEAEHMMEVVHQIAEHDVWHGSLTYRRRDGVKFKPMVSFIAIRNVEGQPQALGVLVRGISVL